MVSSDDSSRGVLVSTRSRPEDQNPRPELDRPSEPTDPSQLWLPRIFGNPAPLGLCAFALTCFTSSAITVRATETVKLPDAVTASALAYGGFVQILVGMWYASWILAYGCIYSPRYRELARGNTFNATSFCSYGAYWITFAIISVLGKLEAWMDPGHRQSDEPMGLFMIVANPHPP
ncbi:GPR FUN34 family protein [Aspergillus sclerotialis]|uniref:GPR FUN34 family protein n=1 Tax=Aspergillus sclerotialis TaxID=2070753 RepID=A0A3A2ZPV2_9EURO|nr:GPR FUN34 family protein [Aspergillus sclerotialis]